MNHRLAQLSNAKALNYKNLKYTLLSTVAEQRQASHSKGSRGITQALLHHLRDFAGGDIRVEEATPRFCFKFAKYLLKNVKVESARTYLEKLHAILTLCVKLGYLKSDPMPDINELLPRKEWTGRTFLTVSELTLLAQSRCPSESTKQAFLFSCLTGLRLSDIETLKWSDIHQSPFGPLVVKCQKKTHREVQIPLCEQAVALLDAIPRTRSKNVFLLRSRSSIANDLKSWSLDSGIGKKITFHCARHTFASMLFSSGVELAVISRLCGHSNIRTTEIYAHIADIRLKEGITNIEKQLAECPKKDFF